MDWTTKIVWKEEIRELQEDLLGMTVDGFAQFMHVSLKTVQRWKRGECVPLLIIRQRLDYLQKNAYEIEEKSRKKEPVGK